MCSTLAELIEEITEIPPDKLFILSECSQTLKKVFYKEGKDKFLLFIDKEPVFVEDLKFVSVFLAGLIELLCEIGQSPIPNWIEKDSYYLDKKFSSISGYNKEIPKPLLYSTLCCFAKRNYYTNEKGVLV